MLADRHPEQSVPATIGYLEGIEALRAIAVTWVVMFHYLVVRSSAAPDPWVESITATPWANVIFRNGYLGVDLFFLITGFLLVLPWLRAADEGGPQPGARDFYVRRLRRIVPAYYIQLVLLFVLLLPLVYGRGFIRENAGFVALNAVAHGSFAHYTTPLTSASLNLNPPLWTLAVEAQFYLLLPLLAPVFVRAPLAVAIALAMAAGAWRWLCRNDLDALVAWETALGARWDVPEAAIRHLLGTQLPGYLAHFALGMTLARGWWPHKLRAVSRSESGAWLAALVAAGALFYWTYGLGGGAWMGPWGLWLATLVALGVLFMALVRGGPLVHTILVHKPVLTVGRWSYSIYLYHLPLLVAWNLGHALDGSIASLPLYLALVLAVAATSYRFVEKPFIGR